MRIASIVVVVVAVLSLQPAGDELTGNWVARSPRPDGTSRDTYFNLKQDRSRISGTVRVTQFFYRIVESTGGPEGFTII